MYAQITTRCNMRCAHCGHNCTNRGTDMSPEIFDKICSFVEKYGDTLTLGGGEPTLHPNLKDFLWKAICCCDDEPPYIITNGKKTKEALFLAKLIEKDVIGGQLSLDPFHEPIDTIVEETFKNINNGIRDTSQNLCKSGRCDWGKDNNCICPDLVVEPTGNVYLCGCYDSPYLGHINNLPLILKEIEKNLEDFCPSECWQEIIKTKKDYDYFISNFPILKRKHTPKRIHFMARWKKLEKSLKGGTHETNIQ